MSYVGAAKLPGIIEKRLKMQIEDLAPIDRLIVIKGKSYELEEFHLEAKIHFMKKYGKDAFSKRLNSESIEFNETLSEIAYYLGAEPLRKDYPDIVAFRKAVNQRAEVDMQKVVVAILLDALRSPLTKEDIEDMEKEGKEKKTLQ